MFRAGVAAIASLCACGSPGAGGPEPSRLVVLVVIDQWPAWAFEQKRAHLRGGGFERLLSEGEWLVGEHPSAATLTAPGHAVLGTGAPPATSGILANEWYDRAIGKRLPAVVDERGRRSADRLRVPGLADAIAHANRGGKAVAVSLKDRSAILSLGHAGLPIWYDKNAVAWTSHEVPRWLAAYNREHPLAKRIHEVWTPLDPESLPTLSGTGDANPGEFGEKKLDATFPHVPDETGDPADALFAVPEGNTVVVDLALAAIDGEQLGSDQAADLLVVSFSAHDLIGHGWGQESWELWDAELRLDRDLARLLGELDRKVGIGKWSMIVTSDHGASPLPERVGGGRITMETLHEAANQAAVGVLGPGTWIADVKYPTVFYARALLAEPRDVRDRAVDAVIRAMRAYPGIASVERTERLAGDCETRIGDARLICASLDPERSGELVFWPKPHWILQEIDEPVATGHGSLELYDRQVPVILLAPDRARHTPATIPSGTIPITEVAPLLARWLGVPAPAALPGIVARP
jgi:hypothetical protein